MVIYQTDVINHGPWAVCRSAKSLERNRRCDGKNHIHADLRKTVRFPRTGKKERRMLNTNRREFLHAIIESWTRGEKKIFLKSRWDFSFVQKSWRCFLKDDKFESSFRETDAGFYGIMERVYGRRIAMNAMFSRIFYLNEDIRGWREGRGIYFKEIGNILIEINTYYLKRLFDRFF